MSALRARVRRVASELGLSEKQEQTMAQSVALANAHLGLAPEGPLCKQVDRLFQVVGLREASR